MNAPVVQLWVTSACPVSGPSLLLPQHFSFEGWKGLCAGTGAASEAGDTKILLSHVERENIDRTKDSLLVLENHAASGSDPCHVCVVLGFAGSAQHLLTFFLFPFRAGFPDCHPRYGVYSTAKPCLGRGEGRSLSNTEVWICARGGRSTLSTHSPYCASLAVPRCEALLQ